MDARLTTLMRALDEIYGDKTRIVYPGGFLQKQKILLDTAENGKDFPFDGDFVLLDRDSTGVLSVQFNNHAAPAFPMSRQTRMAGVPYDRLILSWAAQAGLFANLWFGYGVEVFFPTGDIQSISGTVDVREQGGNYGASFQSSTALGANTNEVAIAPGSNVAGCRIWNASGFTGGATTVASALLAKASAPVSQIDGDMILTWGSVTNNRSPGLSLPMRMSIGIGKGVYRRSDATAETTALWGIQFTL